MEEAGRPDGDGGAEALNRAHWDDLAEAHVALSGDGSNDYYDAAALVEGRTTLLPR